MLLINITYNQYNLPVGKVMWKTRIMLIEESEKATFLWKHKT